MIKEIYKGIIKQGVSNAYSDTKNKRICLLNTYSLIWLHFILIFPIVDIATGIFKFNVLLAHMFTGLGMVLVFIVNYLKLFEVSRGLWLFIALINMSCFSIFILPANYMENYLIIISGIALSLYTKNRIPIICLIISIVLYFIPFYVYPVYPKFVIDKIEAPAVIGLFLSVYLLVNYFKKLNLKNEKKISIAYDALEESKKSEVAHLQLKSLKAQMNPHFMFNAMNSIQYLVLKGNRDEAYNYLTKFSSIIRENLNMSEKSFVSFDEEFTLLNKYLELEKLRFKDDFQYTIKGHIKIKDVKIPSMIIQPFVENSIKHGLLHKVDGIKNLDIEFQQKQNILLCVITDNGVGIKESKRINKQNCSIENSFSTNAIEQRLMFLKDYYKTDIGFNYLPTTFGTKVEIKIPHLKEEEN